MRLRLVVASAAVGVIALVSAAALTLSAPAALAGPGDEPALDSMQVRVEIGGAVQDGVTLADKATVGVVTEVIQQKGSGPQGNVVVDAVPGATAVAPIALRVPHTGVKFFLSWQQDALANGTRQDGAVVFLSGEKEICRYAFTGAFPSAIAADAGGVTVTLAANRLEASCS